MENPKTMSEGCLIESDLLIELKADGLKNTSLKNYKIAVESLKMLDKDPRKMDKGDLVKWSAELNDRYSESTAKSYRTYVKRYFKWLKKGDLNGNNYPECVEWIKTGGKKRRLPKEILSREEIARMAEAAERQRDEALVWVGYESGCRPGELLGLKVRDVEFDEYGGQIMVDGKTGERRIRLVESAPQLKDWLFEHPKGNDPDAPIWLSGKGGSLGRWSWSRILKKLAEKEGIEKRVHPHLLRHSRATHLAAHCVNEAQLREIFGWTRNSNMPAIYMHLSGRDTDTAILNLYGIDSGSEKNKFNDGSKRRKCPRCGKRNPEEANFCNECGEKLDYPQGKRGSKPEPSSKGGEDKLVARIGRKMMEKFPEVVEEIVQEEKLAADSGV
ncbi:hypothetical protein AKJ58_00945 [candidate division MSBL1 archaeon SCGC-AAA385D11]|uniref:Tyr recombinase domain-containing protein n=1 Tax=candidate division MSBL1 archaeon SCGC-AAA385D11 TaxID=1698286 RepID=A0A133VNR6_9EURY|nr:hypothetical protein AKJ58_00945 [candidate division MSBL1 archaeon SCGC-AAA385D11]